LRACPADRVVSRKAHHYLFTVQESPRAEWRIEAFGRDHPARDVIGAEQLARCGSEHAEAEPRQFVSGEVAVAAIDALRPDRFRVQIGRENAKHAIDMHQIGPMLVKLAL
jgi:hypothetical protein